MNFSRLLPLFSAGFAICYGLAEPFQLYLFTYYPAIGEFAVRARPAAEAGPPILWYGWIAFGVLGGLVAAILGVALPRRWDRRVWPAASWLAPVVSSLLLIYLARVWFS